MNGFQQTVVIIATIILIICLIMIGIALRNKNKTSVFPPVIASCPDYWIADPDDKTGKSCIPGGIIPPPDKPNCKTFPPHNKDKSWSRCHKHQWAVHCGLNWDGISNNSELCGRHDH